ncbi:hypothetical protein FAP39_14535 [Shimia litoralis]|uniref:50S ribosomal protein L35 n=1 Tax=Shimia litoralis TaxID=420403 RepID=A0A4U7MW83_9RHOB|nr:hypothetical protein [Shimia litoralis]TKZ17395.1 hypothetical protein FAP39_14535 [Shimia litoralis]
MNTDYILAIGMLIGVFSIPAMMSAYADERPPRASMAAFILALSLMVLAYVRQPGGYTLTDLPNVVVTVIADIIN